MNPPTGWRKIGKISGANGPTAAFSKLFRYLAALKGMMMDVFCVATIAKEDVMVARAYETVKHEYV